MSSENINISIDQLTMVLKPVVKFDILSGEWNYCISRTISEILDKTGLSEMAGEPELSPGSRQKGYQYSYVFPGMLGLLAISYHENRPDMGICINFSATALSEYCVWASRKFNSPMDAAALLKLLQFQCFYTRVSRIDIAVDYIDFPPPFSKEGEEYFSVDSFYRDFESGQVTVYNQDGISRLATSMGIESDYNCQTIYLGSKQSDVFLRIYDKKAEQMGKQAKGQGIPTHHKTALNCKRWVRIEAVYRSTYANQIGDMLMDYTADAGLPSLLAGIFTDKFQFYHGERPLNITKELLALRGDKHVHLDSIKVEDTTLEKMIVNLLDHTSFKAILLYMHEIYGAKGLWELLYFFIKYFYKCVEPLYRQAQEAKIPPTGAMRAKIDWIRKHRNATLDAFPSNSDLLHRLWDNVIGLFS